MIKPQFDTYQLTILLTRLCNLNCTYCFTSNNDEENRLTKESFLDEITIEILLIHSQNIFKTLNIEFFGGEPLIYFEELKYLILGLKENLREEVFEKIQFQLPTNLLLMNKDMYQFLFDNKVEVIFSFDGLWTNIQRPQFNDKANVLDKYLAMKDDIIYYKEHYDLTQCKTMIHPSGLEEYDLVENYIWIKDNFGITPNYEIIRDNKVWDDKSIELFNRENLFLWTFLWEKNSPEYPLPHFYKKWIRNVINFDLKKVKAEYCGIGKNKKLITQTGKTVPCNIFLGQKINGENQILFKDLISNTKSKIEQLINNEKCRQCFISDYCDKGCPIQIYKNNGEQESSLCALFVNLYASARKTLFFAQKNQDHHFADEIKTILKEEGF